MKTWAKVYEGMVKMYKKEVLGKLPIMQHFLFGTLIPFTPSQNQADDEEGGKCEANDPHHHHDYAHASGQLPDCCISRVPSVFGAPQQQQQKKIPFD